MKNYPIGVTSALKGWTFQPSGLNPYPSSWAPPADRISVSFGYQVPKPLESISFSLDIGDAACQDSSMSSTPLVIPSASSLGLSAGAPEALKLNDDIYEALMSKALDDIVGYLSSESALKEALVTSPMEKEAKVKRLTNSYDLTSNAGTLLSGDLVGNSLYDAVVSLQKANAALQETVTGMQKKAAEKPIDYHVDSFILGLPDYEAQRMIKKGDKLFYTEYYVRRAFSEKDIPNAIAMEDQTRHGQKLKFCLNDGGEGLLRTLDEWSLVNQYLCVNNMDGFSR